MLSLHQTVAIAKNEWKIICSDPSIYAVLVLMPLVVMFFFSSPLEGSSGISAYRGVNHTVPGLTAMFALLFMSSVGAMFFREHGWSTWFRLRLVVKNDYSIVFGKTFPLLCLCFTQIAATYTLGALMLGLPLVQNLLSQMVIHLVLACCVVSMGLVLASLCRTVMQTSSISQVLTLLLGGIGGSFTPYELLPEYIKPIAPLSPVYWAISAYQKNNSGESFPTLELVILTCITLVCVTIFLKTLDYKEPKVYWS